MNLLADAFPYSHYSALVEDDTDGKGDREEQEESQHDHCGNGNLTGVMDVGAATTAPVLCYAGNNRGDAVSCGS